MIKFSIRLSQLDGTGVDFVHSFRSLGDAVAYGEKLVAFALSLPGLPAETPIFLNVYEEDNRINPSFLCGRYGTSEDAPIVAQREVA